MKLGTHVLLAMLVAGSVFAAVLILSSSSAVAFGAAGLAFILYWITLFSSFGDGR